MKVICADCGEDLGEKEGPEDQISHSQCVPCRKKAQVKIDHYKAGCKLVNGRFSWFLQVDGQEISFQGSHNAKYFEEHYKELGYEVEWLKENKEVIEDA